MNRSILIAAQAFLLAAGYYTGSLDGDWGPASNSALNAFAKNPLTGGSERDICELAQRHLRATGFNPGIVDGRPGPKTRAAARAFVQSLEPAEAELVGGFASRLVAVARLDVGSVYETSRNHGPGIAKFWPATTYPDGYADRQPYCAAAVCYWVAKAAAGFQVGFTLPGTAAAFGFETWARNNRPAVLAVLPDKARAGDIVVFTFSHVAVVSGWSGGDLKTIEANTNPAGDREGNGCYEKTRDLSLVRSIHRVV